MSLSLKPIAYVRNAFDEKFGIPRQSGLVQTHSELVFEKEYSRPEAFRSLEQFSHLWLIWGFSLCSSRAWRPTVRPPKLGGNRRMGVFATRSPFRPNPLGLSSVELVRIRFDEDKNAVLEVRGADLANGTPVYDVKPYLPYTDSHPNARSAWADPALHPVLQVEFSPRAAKAYAPDLRRELIRVLEQDPRPAYQEDPSRRYTMSYAGEQISFFVEGSRLVVE